MQLRAGTSPRRMHGLGLIEILVTVLLISFGILSLAHLHASSFRYAKMAQFKGIATQLAFELTDRMRANTRSAVAGNYTYTATYNPDTAAVTVPGCTATQCTGAEIAAIDLAEMRNAARTALPGGDLRIASDPTEANVLNVWIIWLDPEAHGNSGGSTTASLACPADVSGSPMPQCLAMRTAL